MQFWKIYIIKRLKLRFDKKKYVKDQMYDSGGIKLIDVEDKIIFTKIFAKKVYKLYLQKKTKIGCSLLCTFDKK